MKNIIKLSSASVIVLALSTAYAAQMPSGFDPQPAPDQIQEVTDTSKPKNDPAVDFFINLSTCVPGDYREQNLLVNSVGTPWLDQQIIGLDDEGYCHALISTPDGRTQDCYFDPYDLSDFGSPHFIQGIKDLYNDPTSQTGLKAENEWSQLKDQNCGYR